MGDIRPIADAGGPFRAILIGRVNGAHPSDAEQRGIQPKLIGSPDYVAHSRFPEMSRVPAARL